jgi:class 3 adenylate cyclase/tetratricopeptide (TPR) repeat protein
VQTCPACGQENPEGFRLCGMCGAPLAEAAAPAREERKVVSVLFTDLVGSTAMAERLDPEDVRAVLAPYYARLRSEIERHGGTVEKFIGDAVMAVFGAPLAHEDDAERAVRAALAIRDAVAGELEIRTAVNTGEALVALGARPTEGEGMVSGDVVNTAARLQSAAPVNGILVGETTYRATRHAIEYREAPPVEAKGKAEPVAVWEALGARARLGLDVEQRLRTPLVGRERERSMLADALARARSEESVQLVTLVGAPGIGKSRLVAELFQIAEADPDLIAWRQGRSLPYGELVSYWALGEIVKSHAGILETDDAAGAETKLAALLETLLEDEHERGWVARNARPLVGLEGGERPQRDESFAAWRRLLEAAAEQRPLVLVFEDLHWADDGVLDFVDHLADWATAVPLLILGTARPELLDRRPGWGGGKRNAFTVSLGALTDEETARLLQRLLDRAVLDAETQQAVLRRAEGNPLYAEEYARMLVERPGDDLPLPETVQGLIAARIDALPAAEKAVLQDASVIGKVFWPSAVGGASDALLHALERKEFVRRERRSAIAGETQYAFLHALVRDVAYGQIPRAQRVTKHREAAEWVAALAADRSEDRAEMAAHHYREALRLAQAAGVDTGDIVGPARDAFAVASERAASLGSWSAAVELARESLDLCEEGDRLRPDLQLRIARCKAWGPAGELDRELAKAARDGFLALGELEGATEAESLLSWLSWWASDGESARAHRQRSLELGADLPASVAKARAFAQAARLEAIGGDPAEAVRLADDALALAEALGREDLQSNALNSRGIAKENLGDDTCLADLERSVELADRSVAPMEMNIARNNLGSVLYAYGRLAESNRVLLEGIDVSRRYGVTNAGAWTEMQLAIEFLIQGRLDEAAARMEAIDARIAPETQLRNGLRYAQGWILGVRGETEEALGHLDQSLSRARLVGERQAITPCLCARALALCVAGRDGEAEADLHELLTMPGYASPRNATGELALLLAERGRGEEWLRAVSDVEHRSAWISAGEAAVRGDYLAAAAAYEAIGAHFLEAWARLLAAERGELAQLEPARALFARTGAVPFLRRCEAVLSASA